MGKKIVMRIMHLLNSNRYSGAENVVLQIIRNSPESIEAYYVSPRGEIEETLRREGINYLLIDKLSVHTIKESIKKIKPDIIHAHDYTASILSSMCFSNAKIISHLHNNAPWIKKICTYSVAYGLSTIVYSKILTVSDSIENEYVFSKFIRKKIQCIGNPINLHTIIEKSEEYKVEQTYDMVFIGRLTEAKNPEMLVEIIKKLIDLKKGIKIAIVGDGQLYTNVKKKLESYDNVKMYGFKSNPYPILKNAKVLCLPSKWEGFGLVAVEAMALGVPVVCSGAGGLKDLINDSCGKICNNSDEYIEEISLLLDNREYYDIKSKAAFCRAKDLDNIDSYMNRVIMCYQSINKK